VPPPRKKNNKTEAENIKQPNCLSTTISKATQEQYNSQLPVIGCQSTRHSLKSCDELTVFCHGSLFVLGVGHMVWMDYKLVKKLIQCRLCSVNLYNSNS